jgi:tetratricopeptide (TPR) repeat protein
MRRRLHASLAALLLALAGCASAPPAPPPETLFEDAAFAPPSRPVVATDAFAMSDEMRRYLDRELADSLQAKGFERGLVDALYKRSALQLEYDSKLTRNAAETFHARSGNCLSLVLMTASFAKALGLAVTYQSAYTDETWSRSGDLYFKSGHVNIALGRRLIDRGDAVNPPTRLQIDFLPPSELKGLRTVPIGEATVVAMYMNNRSAEALARGEVADAYWWAREAVRQAPGFASAWNTLGVVYLRHGEPAQAERVFARVLEREPDNAQALSNRAQALARLGRTDEAAALQRRLAQLEPYPPFHFFDLGQAAMKRGDYAAARDLFAREIDRAHDNAEFQYWLALAEFRLGDTDSARRHLALAMENSATRDQRDLYAAKLAWLRSYRRQ